LRTWIATVVDIRENPHYSVADASGHLIGEVVSENRAPPGLQGDSGRTIRMTPKCLLTASRRSGSLGTTRERCRCNPRYPKGDSAANRVWRL
jgi:hypothetical protein